MDNPLLALAFNELPPFSRITPEHIEPAIEHILNENRNTLKKILENSENCTWDSLVWPLERMEGKLDDLWSTVSHLNAVVNNPRLHEAYQASLSKLSLYNTEMKQNEGLYQAILSITKNQNYAKLDFVQKKIVENILRDFRLAGITLPIDQREQFKILNIKLAELESQFEQNVLEATNAWFLLITDRERLKGLPALSLELARRGAQNIGKEGWLLTLDFPSYHAAMTYLDDRAIRQELYKAYTTRAANTPWNNSAIMQEIMEIRQKLSDLLGFSNYAEYALVTRMLKKPSEVMEFLTALLHRSHSIATKELEVLKIFAREEYQIENLEVWDIFYISEKMLQKKYAFSEEELRQYFPEERVLNGLFEITKRLFDIKINEIKNFDSWHESVRLFEIYDSTLTLRGKFYIDLYTRSNKQGGAWVANAKVRMKNSEGQLQLPVVYLTANFLKPTEGMPLLTHDEVLTLFHEFGHCLHHMLTTIDYPSVSSGNGVMWDAIELPSQLMENWAWEKEAINLCSRHFKTNAPLPEDLFLKLTKVKNFQVGLKLIKQLEYALFDFELHLDNKLEENANGIQEVLDAVRKKTAVIFTPSFNRSQNSFTHIFSGDYAAGYYSYLWSEVLSADIYELFKEKNNIFNKEVAKRFVSTILEPGGSKDFMDLFVEFRGRIPAIDALFRQYSL